MGGRGDTVVRAGDCLTEHAPHGRGGEEVAVCVVGGGRVLDVRPTGAVSDADVAGVRAAWREVCSDSGVGGRRGPALWCCAVPCWGWTCVRRKGGCVSSTRSGASICAHTRSRRPNSGSRKPSSRRRGRPPERAGGPQGSGSSPPERAGSSCGGGGPGGRARGASPGTVRDLIPDGREVGDAPGGAPPCVKRVVARRWA